MTDRTLRHWSWWSEWYKKWYILCSKLEPEGLMLTTSFVTCLECMSLKSASDWDAVTAERGEP